MHSNKIGDEERIIELILEQRKEKIIIFKPYHQEERHRATVKGNRQMGFQVDRFTK